MWFIAAVSFLRRNPLFVCSEKPPQRRLGGGFIHVDKDLHTPESTDTGSRDWKWINAIASFVYHACIKFMCFLFFLTCVATRLWQADRGHSEAGLNPNPVLTSSLTSLSHLCGVKRKAAPSQIIQATEVKVLSVEGNGAASQQIDGECRVFCHRRGVTPA